MSAKEGCVCPGGCVSQHAMGQTPHVNSMTDNRFKNITFPQISFAGGNEKVFQLKTNGPLADRREQMERLTNRHTTEKITFLNSVAGVEKILGIDSPVHNVKKKKY